MGKFEEKRKKFFDSRIMYANYSPPKVLLVGGSLRSAEQVLGVYESARRAYLSELLYRSTQMLEKSVGSLDDIEAFYFKAGFIHLNTTNFMFHRYGSSLGSAGIYGALPWGDFEQVLTNEELVLFCVRGVSPKKILKFRAGTVVFEDVIA